MKHIVANRFLCGYFFNVYLDTEIRIAGFRAADGTRSPDRRRRAKPHCAVFVLRQRGEIRRLLITLSLYVSPYLRLKLNIFFQIEAFCARCAGKGLIRYALRHSYFPHFS